MDECVDTDAQYMGAALCVDSRYALDLARGMIDDGLILA